MELNIYKNYYIKSDKYSFIACRKNEKIQTSFSVDENDEVLEDDFKDAGFSLIGYFGDFLSALSCIKNEIIRESKASTLKELNTELEELKEVFSQFFNKEDYFILLENLKNFKVKPYSFQAFKQSGNLINKERPFSKKQIEFIDIKISKHSVKNAPIFCEDF